MTERPKGRGRGRGRARTPPKPPSDEAMARLQESDKQSRPQQPTSEQFADLPTEQPHPSNAHIAYAATSSNTIVGNGGLPPLAQDIKNALKQGIKVNATSKLDPLSPEFSPLGSPFDSKNPLPTLNGPSRGLELGSSYAHSELPAPPQPIVSKMQNISLSTPQLNASAPEFIPSFTMQPSAERAADPVVTVEQIQEEVSSLGPDDIIHGFTPVGEVGNPDSENVIKAVAEVLIKGTLYIGSFDRFKLKVMVTLSSFPTSPALFDNLAEMLIHWGVMEPYFRYTSCKVCEVILENDSSNNFRNSLLRRMKEWYTKESRPQSDSNDDHFRLINFSLYFSELFSRVKIGDKPVEKLVDCVFSLVNTLLALKSNDTIIGACNILKLTGALLEQCQEGKDDKKMEKVIEQLKDLVTETTPNRSCTELIARVIEQHARGWNDSVGITRLTSPPLKEEKGTLNIDAAPFIPSNFQCDLPVTNIEEWNEFETEYDPDLTIQGVDYDCPDGEDGLDPDIEAEMEAFIEEIEEHLLMQEFDPDEHNM